MYNFWAFLLLPISMLQISNATEINDQDEKTDMYILTCKWYNYNLTYNFDFTCAGGDLVREQFGKDISSSLFKKTKCF